MRKLYQGQPELIKIVMVDHEDVRHIDYVYAVDMMDAIEHLLALYRETDSIWEDLSIENIVSVECIDGDLLITRKAGVDGEIKEADPA